MKVLIIEDEAPASRRLQKMLLEINPEIEIMGNLESIEASIKWFNANPIPELIFMDIQLSDGLSFEIFKHVNVSSPVIFTTAYDDYAIQAFKVNSIDYLLKPIDTEDLLTSLDKLKKFEDAFKSKSLEISDIIKELKISGPAYKSRFLIKLGSNLVIVPSNEIAYFAADNRLTYLVTFPGKKYIIDNSLEELESLLDPDIFTRASRKYIININSLENISTTFSGRLKLTIKPRTDEEVTVSRERTTEFKKWIDR